MCRPCHIKMQGAVEKNGKIWYDRSTDYREGVCGMKRIFVILLAVIMLFTGSACVGQGEWKLRREKMTGQEAEWQPSQEETVIFETRLGSVRGIRRGEYLEFRGIRYAAAERWEEAVPISKWEGVYDATQWGDRCLQHKGFYGTANSVTSQFYEDEALVEFSANYSEDGLNLNIWTPEGAENCPVLVYIHGGAFITGSNSDPAIDGEAYAHHGVITVSINYRLGPFASAYADGYTGNLALTDQLTALRWIKANIADYGGDPSRITLMGESAGAISVQNLLISPLVEDGLIAGAIMLSGGGSMRAIGTPVLPAVPVSVWRKVKEETGVGSLSELKKLPAQELFEQWSSQMGALKDLAAQPVLNGKELTGTVSDGLKSNQVKDVPVIIGMLSHDIVPHALYTSAVEYGQKRAEMGGEPVYLYYFDRIPPGTPSFGAFHGADLYYVFGTLYRNRREFSKVDYRIAEDMIDYISNFVKTGDPNGEGLAQWESSGAETQRFMHFGDDAPSMTDPDPEELARTQKTHPMFPVAPAIRPAK